MKRTAQIAVIGALLAMGVAQSYAQSNAVVVSQLNVALSGFAGDSSTSKPVKITNKDILKAIGGTNGPSFGKNAKLMIGVPAAGGSPSFFVRETTGRTFTDTDVSNFFGTNSSDVVSNGRTQYEILSLSFNNGAGTSFDVNGAATDKIGKVTGRDTGVLDGQITSFTSTVSGTGEVDSTFSVLKGTVGASGAKGELH